MGASLPGLLGSISGVVPAARRHRRAAARSRPVSAVCVLLLRPGALGTTIPVHYVVAFFRCPTTMRFVWDWSSSSLRSRA